MTSLAAADEASISGRATGSGRSSLSASLGPAQPHGGTALQHKQARAYHSSIMRSLALYDYRMYCQFGWSDIGVQDRSKHAAQGLSLKDTVKSNNCGAPFEGVDVPHTCAARH